jgi:2'-5' RNA ligase
MKRIFTAIDISDKTRMKTADYIKNLREEFSQVRVGWERAEKLHLTLKFFGDVDEEQLAKLTAAVEETANQLSGFKLQITKTGVFPSKRNARILWLGVHDEKGSLQKLNEILENECDKKGFVREKRNFKAHLTIACLREPHKSKKLVEGHLGNEFNSPEFQVFKIAIYESRLQKTGSIYNKIKNVELKIQNQ